MYLSTHKKKVKDKIYISYSLRTSYRDTKGKVRHKHIANLPKCTDEEIKALRLALTFKGKLEELGSIEDISITNESSFGGTYVGSFPLDFFVKPFDRKIQRIGTYL